jgi:NADPH-dependent 2,4-dienoyl-CoA reductase/sulfur reductase-like enzyme
MSAHFDVVVVGAGPGGMAAATVAAEAGRSVCLLDDNASPGGQIWRGFKAETACKYPHGKAVLEWTTRFERSGCGVDQGWQVIDNPKPGLLRLERVDGRGNERGGVRDNDRRDVGFEKLILATGARERFLPFPGWTLPGVMGAGGLQALVKSGLDPRGKRVVLAGSGPLLLAVGAGLAVAGACVLGIYEQAPLASLASFAFALLAHPGKLVEGARYRRKTQGAPYRTGTWVVQAEGRGRVERVTLTDGRKQWSVDCDWLGCGFHLVPNLELPRLLGCGIVNGFVAVDRLQQSSVHGVACVGELTGIGGLDKALVEGQIAGYAAAGRATEALRLGPKRQRLQRFAARLDRAFALRPELRTLATAETAVCRCEDVPLSALESCAGWRQAKLHTRCGMGACQGRICGVAAEFLFGWENFSARPPVFPAAVSTLAAETHAPDLVDH